MRPFREVSQLREGLSCNLLRLTDRLVKRQISEQRLRSRPLPSKRFPPGLQQSRLIPAALAADHVPHGNLRRAREAGRPQRPAALLAKLPIQFGVDCATGFALAYLQFAVGQCRH